jgi:hypothetical protein
LRSIHDLALEEADSFPRATPAAEVAGGVAVLDRYRILGLPAGSKAGDACRRLFDAGRGEAVFTAWLYEGAGEPVPGGPVPDSVRDARIVELRRSGWTLAAIAEEVGLSSKAAVSNALSRIACELERPAPPRVGVRGDGTSEDW